MSPKIKGILRIFLPALAVGILLSLLFLALMNGPLAQPAAEPTAAPTATPASEATPYDPSVTPEPTQPTDSLFSGITKVEIETSPWMLVAYAAAVFGGIAMARRIKNRNAKKTQKTKKK